MRSTHSARQLVAGKSTVLSADDCALVAHAESHLQLMFDHFSEVSKLFGLTISLGKTQVLCQPAPTTHLQATTIVIESTQLKNMEHFKYLGSTISSNGSLDKDIDAQITTCCTENFRKERETKVVQKSATRTQSKPISSGVNSNQRNWRTVPVVDQAGEPPSTKLLSLSRMLVARSSLLPDINATEHQQQ
ncbi:uncharacterized protein [Haliotis asinina]|uniref:uncharacterized protein n=1 Tax=Haliotis asinina TaxID=109174 RepID=UPI0035321DB0